MINTTSLLSGLGSAGTFFTGLLPDTMPTMPEISGIPDMSSWFSEGGPTNISTTVMILGVPAFLLVTGFAMKVFCCHKPQAPAMCDEVSEQLGLQLATIATRKHLEKAVEEGDEFTYNESRKHFGEYTPNEDGETLLHAAARGGHSNMVTKFSAGCDVNTPGKDGNMPLHYAAERGRKDAVELLIEGGALQDAKNRHGQTPADLAKHYGHDDVLRLLVADID